MQVGIFEMDIPQMLRVGELIDRIGEVEGDGLDAFWLWHAAGRDAIGLLGAAGRQVPRIELGTNVVAIQPRHPLALAQQAVTASELTEGRFTLGVGVSHRPSLEGRFRMEWDRPASFAEDYLDVLLPVLAGEEANTTTGRVGGVGAVLRADRHPIPVLLAALGPRMLGIAGRRTAGTTVWMTGPKTIESHVRPTLRAAGSTSSRILAALPVLVTDDVESGRERAEEVFARYGTLPSYRAVLDREGWDRPGQAAVIGTEEEVLAELERYRAAGVTDLAVVEFGVTPDDRRRTRAVLQELATI